MENKRIKEIKRKLIYLKESRHLLTRRKLSLEIQNKLYKEEFQSKQDVEELEIAIKQINKSIQYYESLLQKGAKYDK